MAVRIGMLLSGLAIFFLSVALADFLVVGSEGTRVYVIYYLLWLTVALAFIWLGVFVGHVVAKAFRVTDEAMRPRDAQRPES